MDKDYIKQLEEENAGLKRVRDKIMPKLTRQINKYITAMEYLIEENNKLKKVIEILKKKIVVIVALKLSKDLNDYNRMTNFENLTQEEYEVLKEILEND